MIGTIFSALIVGLIAGALARLVIPGKQNIGIIMTIVLSAIGSFVASWLTYSLGYKNANGGWAVIPFLGGHHRRRHADRDLSGRDWAP